MELVTPGIGLLFWMTISFLILLLIMVKYGWPAILDIIKEREKTIDDALHAAERAKQETMNMQLANEELLQKAKLERIEMLKEARMLQEKIISEAKAEASEEARRMVESAKEAIRSERHAALAELKGQIAKFSVEIAEKILTEELKKDQKQQEYIKKLVDEIHFN
jgi:F-type H+-transporting ATPase subunit b